MSIKKIIKYLSSMWNLINITPNFDSGWHSFQHLNTTNDFPVEIQYCSRPGRKWRRSYYEMQKENRLKYRFIQTDFDGYKYARDGWSCGY